MRTSIFILLCIAGSIVGSAKSINGLINIVSLDIKPVMPGQPQSWYTVANGLSLNATTNPSAGDVQSRLVVQIRQGSNKFCGGSPATGISVSPFASRIFSAADMMPALSQCPSLNKGTYTICVQFFNDKNEPISAEACKEFAVEMEGPSGSTTTSTSSTTTTTTTTYSPPQNVSPADKKVFRGADLRSPLRFSWTPVKPLPQEKITYRLRIWKVEAGEEVKSVMSGKEELLTKDLANLTEATIESESLPCSSPACTYIWNVQALNSLRQPIGNNKGNSDPTAIVISDYIIRINDIKVSCTATPGVYSLMYSITNPNATTAKLTNFVVTSSTPGGATISTFSPPLNTTIAPANTLVITGTITASPLLSNICVGAEITDVANTFWKASRDTCIPVAPCKCDFCESPKTKITISGGSSVVNANNTITLTQPVTITTSPAKLIKSVRAELMYFEFIPESDECMPCNKDSKTFGNLTSGTMASVTGAGTDTHALLWNFFPPKSFTSATNAVMTFTFPPTVKCCSATIRWCIRYVITFADCTVCSKVVCYEKRKDGCATGNGNGNPNANN